MTALSGEGNCCSDNSLKLGNETIKIVSDASDKSKATEQPVSAGLRIQDNFKCNKNNNA